MFIHDIIKSQYSSMGYLPGYPYHLISDAEMFDAFLREDGFFNDYYPCPGERFEEAYTTLREYIAEKISEFMAGGDELPSWIYSYMLMRPITYASDEADIAYLYDLLGMDPPEALAEFSEQLAGACLEVSRRWLQKLPSKSKDRPPTMFGETHVTKSLRLDQANVLIEYGEP